MQLVDQETSEKGAASVAKDGKRTFAAACKVTAKRVKWTPTEATIISAFHSLTKTVTFSDQCEFRDGQEEAFDSIALLGLNITKIRIFIQIVIETLRNIIS